MSKFKFDRNNLIDPVVIRVEQKQNIPQEKRNLPKTPCTICTKFKNCRQICLTLEQLLPQDDKDLKIIKYQKKNSKKENYNFTYEPVDEYFKNINLIRW